MVVGYKGKIRKRFAQESVGKRGMMSFDAHVESITRRWWCGLDSLSCECVALDGKGSVTIGLIRLNHHSCQTRNRPGSGNRWYDVDWDIFVLQNRSK